MYKREYSPLFDSGFREIALWQLDEVFLSPFGENEQRKYLIDRIQAFINEFQALGIDSEVWIDGSFSTLKPDPVDVDIVFLFEKEDIDGLDHNKQELFMDLFQNREKVRTRFSIDVYYIDKNNIEEQQRWIETFGFDTRKLNSKGIFKIILKKNV